MSTINPYNNVPSESNATIIIVAFVFSILLGIGLYYLYKSYSETESTRLAEEEKAKKAAEAKVNADAQIKRLEEEKAKKEAESKNTPATPANNPNSTPANNSSSTPANNTNNTPANNPNSTPANNIPYTPAYNTPAEPQQPPQNPVAPAPVNKGDPECAFINSDADLLTLNNFAYNLTFPKFCCGNKPDNPPCDCGGRSFIKCGKCSTDNKYYRSAAWDYYNKHFTSISNDGTATQEEKQNFITTLDNLNGGALALPAQMPISSIPIRSGVCGCSRNPNTGLINCTNVTYPGCTCTGATQNNINYSSWSGEVLGNNTLNIRCNPASSSEQSAIHTSCIAPNDALIPAVANPPKEKCCIM